MKREDEVGRRLASEARGIRREAVFSLPLHGRIMGALRENGGTFEEAAAKGRFAGWRVMVPVGIAAAVGVAVWMGLPGTEETGGKKQVAVVSKPVEKVVPVVAGGGMNGAAAALERGKYAYLDRDANRLFMFVADQIPSFGEQK